MSAEACRAKKIRTREIHALRPSHPHRQLPQRPPAGVRGRRPAFGSGSHRPRAEDVPELSRHHRPAHRAAGGLRLRPAPVHVPGPDAGRRHGHQGCLRAGLAGHLAQLPGMQPRVPGRRRARRRCRRPVRGGAGPGAVRRREPGPHLLRGGPHLRVSRRTDHPGHQGRPGRGDQHARRSRGHVLVPAELRERRHRVPQPVLRRRNRGGPGAVAQVVARGPMRPALALVRPPGRQAAPQPARRPAEDDQVRGPAEQARRGPGRALPLHRHHGAGGRDPRCGPHGPAARPSPPAALDPRSARRTPPRSTSWPARNSAGSATPSRADRPRGRMPRRSPFTVRTPVRAASRARRLSVRRLGRRTGCGTGRRTSRRPRAVRRGCRAR